MERNDIDAINRLSKQLRTIKIMLAVFLVMVVANLVALGFITFTVVVFTKDITNRVENIQNSTTKSLDFKTKICDNTTLRAVIGSSSDICK